MGKSLVAKNEIVLKYNVKNIWDIVVNNNDYKWRTDIKEIEMLENGKDWIEYYDINKKYFKDLEKKLYAADPEDNLPEIGSFGA